MRTLILTKLFSLKCDISVTTRRYPNLSKAQRLYLPDDNYFAACYFLKTNFFNIK